MAGCRTMSARTYNPIIACMLNHLDKLDVPYISKVTVATVKHLGGLTSSDILIWYPQAHSKLSVKLQAKYQPNWTCQDCPDA